MKLGHGVSSLDETPFPAPASPPTGNSGYRVNSHKLQIYQNIDSASGESPELASESGGIRENQFRGELRAHPSGQLVTVGAWFREDWVPSNLLGNYLHERKQVRAAEKKRKRAAEQSAEEAGPSKRSKNTITLNISSTDEE
ncbi:hypothetical protein CF327_g7130 [Tilletia walkeri]|nr:hypothetical protein CF327_g7130 [Tilletia walkeri]